jgi:proteasome lid subunit RPN8/RPN11
MSFAGVSIGAAQRALSIRPSLDVTIRRHAEREYPHECCGALLGRQNDILEVVALPNADRVPRSRFFVGPDEYRRVEQRARAEGLALLGFYHSHPDCAAQPSSDDLEQAWPSFAYLIVSVRRGHAEPPRAWRLRNDRSHFDELDLAPSD